MEKRDRRKEILKISKRIKEDRETINMNFEHYYRSQNIMKNDDFEEFIEILVN